MAWLNENNKFIKQTNLGWTFSFEANGRRPMIANRIFATKAGAEAYIADITANASAIPGLILRVIKDEDTPANNGAYLVEEDSKAASGLKLTRIATGALNISGEMIDVIWYNGDPTYVAGYYNKADGSGEPWVPSTGAEPIIDEQVDEEGKYLCLKLNETNKEIYIKSTDLIDLSDYYTKNEIDNDIIKPINDHLNNVDTSIDIIIDILDVVTEDIEKINDHLDEVDSSIEDISTRLANLKMVKSVSTNTPEYLIINPSMGDVTINVDVSTSIDSTTFQNTALVTNGYIDEKLAWVEIE